MSLPKALAAVVGLSGFAFCAGFGISGALTMPDNAVLYLDPDRKVYLASPCVGDFTGLRLGTPQEARHLKFSPDPSCREKGAFLSEDRSLSGQVLVSLGILKPMPSRWNSDGSWRW